MSSGSYIRAGMRSALFLLSCLAVGCASDSSLTTTLSIVPEDELSHLHTECDSLLNAADEDLMWARAAGDDDAIVLDTPDGSCVARRETVLSSLSGQHRDALVAHIVRDFAAADPSPHPDLTSPTTVSADPAPHPDRPQDTPADPSPHPDKDDDDDVYAIVIVVDVVVGGGSTGGNGTPPPPPPPAPTKPD